MVNRSEQAITERRVRRRVVVAGLVQGVFFRASLAERARMHGVDGWVQNNLDGTVEAVFEGEPDAVDRVVDFCRHGPGGARVDAIRVRDETPAGDAGFSVR